MSEAYFGWLPDLPSIKDYTVDHEKVKPLIARVCKQRKKDALPEKADLRSWCSPVEDQLDLGSCTANAGVGMVEYYERRAFGKHIDASRLFLYKTTRDLLKSAGDTGAFLRTTMEAMVLFGLPPESYWPYVVKDFDKEPSAFLYSFGQNYQALNYYRLDPAGTDKAALLKQIKTNISSGLPSMFGFTVYSSYVQASTANRGSIPYPTKGDRVVGGHAVVAAGYDDALQIRNGSTKATIGAFLIRNSWGAGWGDAGYGWLPYDYVLKGLATDWWALISQEWVDTGNFG
jgi:C1A family cysteine protease